jgi:hypothetical protein
MRYADMLSQLKHPFATDEKPSELDAVHVLLPVVNGCSPEWLPHSDVAPTPTQIDGIYTLDYLQQGRPLPKEFVPASLKIKGFKYKKKWPESLPRVMPDFYMWRDVQYVVSSSVRDIIESISPGSVQYIEIKIETPPQMLRAPSYFYINVLPQAQMIDWKEAGATQYSRNSKDVPFKSKSASDPLIWHEMWLDKNHRFGQSEILLRGVLWNALIKEFPLQLRAMKISGDD